MTSAECKAVVTAKTQEAEGVVSLTLGELSGGALPTWEPGAHVDLVIDGAPIRQYSLCGDPHDRHTYRLGVLREADGRGGSRHVHDNVREGDVIEVLGPRNHFPLVPASSYLFVAGGIGITPMLPMIAEAERSGASWTLVYGGRRRASMAFLDELASYGDKVSVCPEDEAGLLDLDTILAAAEPGTQIYCCGPEPLLRAIEQRCEGHLAQALHLERFAPKEMGEPGLTEAFEVHLDRSDLTFVVPPDESIATVLEAAGVDILYSCSEGTCGTCETRVVEGVPDHRDSVLTDAERASNDCMMICVSRSCSPRLVLDL